MVVEFDAWAEVVATLEDPGGVENRGPTFGVLTGNFLNIHGSLQTIVNNYSLTINRGLG